jgi:hypothetical protein
MPITQRIHLRLNKEYYKYRYKYRYVYKYTMAGCGNTIYEYIKKLVRHGIKVNQWGGSKIRDLHL